MEDYILFPLIFFSISFVILIAVCFAVSYFRKKRLQEVIAELGLIEGNTYDVIVNNGTKQLNLVYTSIGYGNKSQNGTINIYFNKTTKYRGSLITKQVMIKYGNVWKIYNRTGGNSNNSASNNKSSSDPDIRYCQKCGYQLFPEDKECPFCNAIPENEETE